MTIRKSIEITLWSVMAAGLMLAVAVVFAGCHLGTAIKDAAPGGSNDYAALVGALPGAAAGNPLSWYTIAAAVATFLGTAIVGHKVTTNSAKKSATEIAVHAAEAAVKSAIDDLTIKSTTLAAEKPN